jgi:UDP-N-acetylglucosamine acyltransferase
MSALIDIHPLAVVHSTAVIYPNVKIGAYSYIGPFCVIGAPPEKRGAQKYCGVVIGDSTRLEKAVVIDAGSERATVIGNNCMIMSGAHVGHDCYVGHDVTISPKAVIGGHVSLGNVCNIGMNAGVHQYQVIGAFAMIGANSFVTRLDPYRSETYIWPYSTYVGTPAKLIGRNKKYIDVLEETIHISTLEFIDYITKHRQQ